MICFSTVLRIFFIHIPFQWIVSDIFPDCVQFRFVTDYVFVIIALPEGDAGGVADYVDHMCTAGPECAYNFTNRRGVIYHALIVCRNFSKGRNELRPYIGQYYDAMNVIRHIVLPDYMIDLRLLSLPSVTDNKAV